MGHGDNCKMDSNVGEGGEGEEGWDDVWACESVCYGCEADLVEGG